VIPLEEICMVEKRHSVRFGRFSLTNYILICYEKVKYVSVLPIKEQEFLDLLYSRLEQEFKHRDTEE